MMKDLITCSEKKIDLPEDIWILIFTYLPLYSIYKLRCVSKVWFSILSNPNFVTSWIRFHTRNKSLPWVQFHTLGIALNKHCEFYAFQFRYAYPPDLHSQFISRHEYGFSFGFPTIEQLYLLGSCNGLVFTKDSGYSSFGFTDKKLYLLGSCNGLVLGFTTDSGYNRLHVCNPLTRVSVSLPSPPYFDSCNVGFSCEYSSSNSSLGHYKVVFIPRFSTPSKRFNVDIFSSDLGKWRICEVSCSRTVMQNLPVYNNVVSSNGVVYWIVGENKLLAYNLNHNNTTHGDHQCSLINMPDEELDDRYIKVGSRILGESEGWICYARINNTRNQLMLSVWVLNEDNWQLLHNQVELHDQIGEMVSKVGSAEEILVLGFSPIDRNVVLLGSKHSVWQLNIRTRTFEELCYPSFLGNSTLNDRDKIMMHVQFALKPMPTLLPEPSWNPIN